MDPRDHPRPLPDGAPCTACGAPVPTGRIRILARRDDLAFVELACLACGSAAARPPDAAGRPGGEPILDVPRRSRASRSARARTVRPITAADVEAVRDDLAAWDGDLVGWLDALDDSGRPGSIVDR